MKDLKFRNSEGATFSGFFSRFSKLSVKKKLRRKNEQQIVLRCDFTQKGRNSKFRTKLDKKVLAQHRLDG